MLSALWVSKTGLSAQDTMLTTISNNLANVSTTGFKRDRAEFEDLLYQIKRQPGGQSTQDTQLPSGLQLGTGVRVVGTQKIFTEGTLQTTEQPLDMAVNGRGFFQILMPDGGIGYTRDGSFHLDADGQIVTSNGFPLEPGIVLPDDVQTFPGGPAVDWQQPVPRDRIQRCAAGRQPRSERPGYGVAEHPGEFQRQRRGGAGQHDHHPARLRDELQGHFHRRSDAAVHQSEPLTGAWNHDPFG